jgi:putative tryptophan/tyrosine transport system substrate-binding protein
MRRRDFITLLGGAAVTWPVTARRRQPALPVVGYFGATNAAGDASYIVPARLGESGFIIGQNVAIEFRWADGQYSRLGGSGNWGRPGG